MFLCFGFAPCRPLVGPLLREAARPLRHTNMLSHLIPRSFVEFSSTSNPLRDTRGPRRGAGGRYEKSQKNHVGFTFFFFFSLIVPCMQKLQKTYKEETH